MGPLTSAARLYMDPVVLVARFVPRRIVQSLSTLCGVWTALAPLLLWIHWPPHIWFALLWSALIAMVFTGIFTAALMPPPGKPQPGNKQPDWQDTRSHEREDR